MSTEKLTVEEFVNDSMGRKFIDVVDDERVIFQDWLDFFHNPVIQQRMKDSEIHHNRPALAGVVKELEENAAFKNYLSNYDSHTTPRGRQAIGVIVRLVMENLGWNKTGKKSSLGQRKHVAPGTTTAGAYQNKSGISKWFTKAERYSPPGGYPYFTLRNS